MNHAWCDSLHSVLVIARSKCAGDRWSSRFLPRNASVPAAKKQRQSEPKSTFASGSSLSVKRFIFYIFPFCISLLYIHKTHFTIEKKPVFDIFLFKCPAGKRVQCHLGTVPHGGRAGRTQSCSIKTRFTAVRKALGPVLWCWICL